MKKMEFIKGFSGAAEKIDIKRQKSHLNFFALWYQGTEGYPRMALNQCNDSWAEFPERLRQLRLDRGLSQDEVGPFSRTNIQRWENGLVRPNRRNLHQLAKFFQVPVTDLFDDDHDPFLKRHRLYARAVALLEDGQAEEAHAVALDYSRWAYETGDAEASLAAARLMGRIIPQLEDKAIIRSIFRGQHGATLRRLNSIANYHGQWQVVLTLNEVLIQHYAPGSTDYLKMVRNRGVILMHLGYFSDASRWIRKELEFNPPTNARLLVACAADNADLLEGLPRIGRPHIESHTGTNRILWYLYWWYELHAAWQAEDWSGLKIAYRTAHKHVPRSWAGTTIDYAFLGIDAVLRWRAGLKPLDSLRQVLLRCDRDAVIDEGLADDLSRDWLELLLAMDHPQAPAEWAGAVDRLHRATRDGWVVYWMARKPHTIPWEALPIETAYQVQQLMNDPPGPFVDNLAHLVSAST